MVNTSTTAPSKAGGTSNSTNTTIHDYFTGDRRPSLPTYSFTPSISSSSSSSAYNMQRSTSIDGGSRPIPQQTTGFLFRNSQRWIKHRRSRSVIASPSNTLISTPSPVPSFSVHDDDDEDVSHSTLDQTPGDMSCSWLLAPESPRPTQLHHNGLLAPSPSWGGAPPSPVSPLSIASSPSSSSENPSALRLATEAAAEGLHNWGHLSTYHASTPPKSTAFKPPHPVLSPLSLLTHTLRTALYNDSTNHPTPRFRLAEHLIKTLRHVPEHERAQVISEALDLLRTLVDVDGWPDAMHFFACLLITGVPGIGENGEPAHTPDYEKALVLFRAAAKRGHTDASYHAALCYEHGRGVPTPDPSRALKLYRRAAIANHPGAMTRLARFHLTGSLYPTRSPHLPIKNLKQAVKWLKLAAAHATRRHSLSLYLLASLYEGGDAAERVFEGASDAELARGAGVGVDWGRCVELLREAMRLECWSAAMRLAKALWNGEVGLKRAPREALGVAVGAARKGFVEAMVEVAWMMSADGEWVDEMRGGRGLMVAPSAFGRVVEEEVGFDVDVDEAVYWARKGVALGGGSKAEVAMAFFTEHGIGVSRNLEEALEWYKKAAFHENTFAIARLHHFKDTPFINIPTRHPKVSMSSSAIAFEPMPRASLSIEMEERSVSVTSASTLWTPVTPVSPSPDATVLKGEQMQMEVGVPVTRYRHSPPTPNGKKKLLAVGLSILTKNSG
ncbi:hypothetical protein BC829DRAFT_448378 [Chytridium lagenaria]|nr:hypothetical protein BC829DRAFT_448378 [Chytridium lagenaria]